MENLQETMTAWLRSSQSTEGQLEEAMMATLRDGRSMFLRELLQTMACAWLYELWNIFFRRLQASRTEAKPHWGTQPRNSSTWPTRIAASNTKWGGTPGRWGFRPTRCPPP